MPLIKLEIVYFFFVKNLMSFIYTMKFSSKKGENTLFLRLLLRSFPRLPPRKDTCVHFQGETFPLTFISNFTNI